MTTGASTGVPSVILCADLGKESRKRAVYVADVSARVVRRASVSTDGRRHRARGGRASVSPDPSSLPSSFRSVFPKRSR